MRWKIRQELSASQEVMKQIFERLYIATEEDSEVRKILKEFMAESNRRDQLIKTLLRFDKKNNNGDSNTKSDVLTHTIKEKLS